MGAAHASKLVRDSDPTALGSITLDAYAHFSEVVPEVRRGRLKVRRIKSGFELKHPTSLARNEATDIIVSERAYRGLNYTDWNEMLGLPVEQLTTEYWFPLCDGTGTSQTFISIGNASQTTAQVTVKIAGHPLGENHADTFRVEDGIIKAQYDKYDKFAMQFGHLYSNIAYSRYILRLEYRFVGTKMPDAPAAR